VILSYYPTLDSGLKTIYEGLVFLAAVAPDFSGGIKTLARVTPHFWGAVFIWCSEEFVLLNYTSLLFQVCKFIQNIV
jgi:hypothetical protein